MDTKTATQALPLNRIDAILQPEVGVLLVLAIVGTWFFYSWFLANISIERHKRLRGLFRNLIFHLILTATLWICYRVGHPFQQESRLLAYIGLAAIFWGSLVFLKTCRILAFGYLFLTSPKAGVPVLLINILSLLLSLIIVTWIASSVFGVRLTPLLATSAVFSLVLGLALQDTLGNLFAGVALQLDKPYEIGDWIEVQTANNQKWSGQVKEISWRATILIAFTEELVTISNRIMAQAEILNFAAKTRPFIRGHYFRIPYGADIHKVREALLKAAEGIVGVVSTPAPLVLFMDNNESWMNFKLIYYIEDYGRQFIIGDQVLSKAMGELGKLSVSLATTKLQLVKQDSQTA